MRPVLQIHLLDSFQLIYDDHPVVVNSTRLQSLLAYLLTHRQAPQPRRQIAFLLWPESTEAQAYTNLRRELHHLRRILPDPEAFLAIENTSIQWRPDAPFTLDVMDFQRRFAEATQADSENLAARAQLFQLAVDSYRGPLLPDCYDDWILPLREELEQSFLHALEMLIAILEEQRDYPAAIHRAEQILQHDRLVESAYRQLMRLHSLNKDRARALRVYHDCCAILGQELGVEPAAETQMLYTQLLEREELQTARAGKPIPLLASTALVGREEAWQKVVTAYRMASRGHARMVLIFGEAGIGKTRLAEELLLWAEQQGILTARSRAYMAQGSLVYAPLIELLRTEALQAHWSRLANVWLEELVWLLPELQESRPDLHAAPTQGEQWRRTRLMEALARSLLAGDGPRLLVIDDLQWCDPETLTLLQYLLTFAPRAPILIVGTARPEEITNDHPLVTLRRNLQQEDQLLEIEIDPLSAEETAALARQIAARELASEMVAQLHQQTEGNPLFIVEAVRAALIQDALGDVSKSGSKATMHNELSSSPKVFAVIQSRLAQLSPLAQKLAAVAATIGRSFTFSLLVEASGDSEEEVVRSLDELWQRRIIRAQAINAYDFSHDRIRDVAYAEISPVRRPQIHRRIAEALERVYVDDLDAVASQLAMHYEQAGHTESAIRWHQNAAEVNRRLYAIRDAAKHLQAALDLVALRPKSSARDQLEISLLINLSDSLMIARGITAIERLPPLERALELVKKLGDQRLHFLILRKIQNFHSGYQGGQIADVMSQEVVQIANDLDDPFLKRDALRNRGLRHRARGEFREAYALQLQARAIDQQLVAVLSTEELFNHDGLALSPLDNSAVELGMLGYLDQARAYADKFSTFAIEDPYRLTVYYFMASLVYHIHEDVDKVHNLGELMVAYGRQYELPLSTWSGTFCVGWALAHRGQLAVGITQMIWGINHFREASHIMYQTIRLGGLAELHIQANQLDAAEAALDEARSISEHAHERIWDAEIHRLYGELAWVREEAEEEIELHYTRAYELARHQHAKTLELRAAMSLARLWRQQGTPSRAYTLLAETLNWFTEGFDTPLLKTASALLADLQAASAG